MKKFIKINLKNSIIIILLLCSINFAKSQNIVYQFHPKDETFIDTSPIIDRSSDIWEVQKIVLNDSVFRFGPILCQSDTYNCCFITFKINYENNWYIIDGMNNEYLFYDFKQKKIKDIIFDSCGVGFLSLCYELNVKDFDLKGFELKTLGACTDNPTFWFHEKFGIIAAKNSRGIYYVRNDF